MEEQELSLLSDDQACSFMNFRILDNISHFSEEFLSSVPALYKLLFKNEDILSDKKLIEIQISDMKATLISYKILQFT